jgi:hypothetical protein
LTKMAVPSVVSVSTVLAPLAHDGGSASDCGAIR